MITTEKVNIDELLKRTDELIRAGEEFVISEGKVIEYKEWMTIAEYAAKYNVTTQIVSKWIERGVITENDWVEIGKFGKKLVKDIPYKQ